MFEIGKLTPSLLTNNIINDEFDLRSSRVNLVQMNTRIIDRHKNWNFLVFKEAIKIKEIKPTLNTGLKASRELQLLDLNVCQLNINWYLTNFIVLHFS